MGLYRFQGGPPQQLPEPFFDADNNPWTHLETLSAEQLEEFGFLPAPPQPEFDASTHGVRWNDDAWEVYERWVPPEPPRQIPKVDFWRRFAPGEQVAILGAKKAIAAMTPADFAMVENIGWWQLAVVFETLDLIPNYIEPDHLDTIAGVNAFAQAGFIGSQRVAEILA